MVRPGMCVLVSASGSQTLFHHLRRGLLWYSANDAARVAKLLRNSPSCRTKCHNIPHSEAIGEKSILDGDRLVLDRVRLDSCKRRSHDCLQHDAEIGRNAHQSGGCGRTVGPARADVAG